MECKTPIRRKTPQDLTPRNPRLRSPPKTAYLMRIRPLIKWTPRKKEMAEKWKKLRNGINLRFTLTFAAELRDVARTYKFLSKQFIGYRFKYWKNKYFWCKVGRDLLAQKKNSELLSIRDEYYHKKYNKSWVKMKQMIKQKRDSEYFQRINKIFRRQKREACHKLWIKMKALLIHQLVLQNKQEMDEIMRNKYLVRKAFIAMVSAYEMRYIYPFEYPGILMHIRNPTNFIDLNYDFIIEKKLPRVRIVPNDEYPEKQAETNFNYVINRVKNFYCHFTIECPRKTNHLDNLGPISYHEQDLINDVDYVSKLCVHKVDNDIFNIPAKDKTSPVQYIDNFVQNEEENFWFDLNNPRNKYVEKNIRYYSKSRYVPYILTVASIIAYPLKYTDQNEIPPLTDSNVDYSIDFDPIDIVELSIKSLFNFCYSPDPYISLIPKRFGRAMTKSRNPPYLISLVPSVFKPLLSYIPKITQPNSEQRVRFSIPPGAITTKPYYLHKVESLVDRTLDRTWLSAIAESHMKNLPEGFETPIDKPESTAEDRQENQQQNVTLTPKKHLKKKRKMKSPKTSNM